MKVKPLYTMPTASTQARSTKMWKAQASIRSVLFLINYGIATSLGPEHQLALSRHPDSHTLADLALAKLILRVVVTIQNSSIPMLLSQAAYRVRLQSIMFDRLCIMRVLKIKYKQSSAQPVLALLVRIAFLVYFAPGLISEYILVSIVVYYINTIVYTKYPYKHHSQCIYTTKLQLRYYYIYYSIALSSITIPVPLTPALVLSMELLGVQYQWCPLQQQIVIKDRIQTVFGIACACTLQVRIPFLVYCAPGLISEYVLVSIVVYYINTIVYTKYPYKHHSQCIYTTKLQLRYYYIYYSIAYSSSTMPVPLTPALALSMEILGVAVLVVPTSVADSYQRQNTNSLRHSLCLHYQ
ncbi:Transmembrane domain-containing protein [Spironucleus salmonicida]|uniref:Transmembrane domain-containing protein n=1 Tax=Spironucleus salmonicida TaxID=348837 RepID=A0A9P8LV43_9EUKA|nr:Transmembrane domain-containing protein [Spironucleus salmonicida]